MTAGKPTAESNHPQRAGMLEHFEFTDDDLERGAKALLNAQSNVDRNGNRLDDLPDDEREAAFGNAQEDVRAVLEALGGEWV